MFELMFDITFGLIRNERIANPETDYVIYQAELHIAAHSKMHSV